MTAAIIPMKWAETKHNDDKQRCACCGAIVNNGCYWVEVIDGGKSVAAPGLDPDQNEPGYMGFFPVGPYCARKHFRGFTHDSE